MTARLYALWVLSVILALMLEFLTPGMLTLLPVPWYERPVDSAAGRIAAQLSDSSRSRSAARRVALVRAMGVEPLSA